MKMCGTDVYSSGVPIVPSPIAGKSKSKVGKVQTGKKTKNTVLALSPVLTKPSRKVLFLSQSPVKISTHI